jgi:CHAT domain-containing protein
VNAVALAEFYRAMKKDGMRPAGALRVAQIKMWKEKQWSSPYYFAASSDPGRMDGSTIT